MTPLLQTARNVVGGRFPGYGLKRRRAQGRRFARSISLAVAPGENLLAGRAKDAPNPLKDYFDAHTEGLGIWKWRHYLDVYHRHFSKFVGTEVQVVEVGIYSGGSLQMWRDYFGPGCQVYGVDVREACRAYEADGVRIFIGDQADAGFWEDFRRQVPIVDIVIDDGGHHPDQQIPTLEALLPHIRPGGVYACEDVHGTTNRFAAYVSSLAAELNAKESTEPTAFQQSVHSIHQYPFVTVIEKPEALWPPFVPVQRGTEWQPKHVDVSDETRRRRKSGAPIR